MKNLKENMSNHIESEELRDVGAGFHPCPKGNRAITLIALIITIIVMLILVAVTISILVKSNIIGIGEQAADKTKTAYEKESNLGSKITINGIDYDGISGYMQSKCSHNWGAWNVIKEPSYTEAGEKTRECTKCGLEQTEYPSMLACDEHTYGENDWVIDTPATCKEKGLKYVICTRCTTRIEEEIEIDTENGHNFVDGICTICGKNNNVYDEVLEAPAEYAYSFQAGDDITAYVVLNEEATAEKGENVYDMLFVGTGTMYSAEDWRAPDVVFGNFSCGTGSYLINIETAKISKGIFNIANYAFYDSGLENIKIPTTVSYIEYAAFSNCDLTSIKIPASVTSIGQSAFHGCSGLTSIEIPDSVTSIGQLAFYGCSGLTSIEIPDSVTSIESYAFYGCSGMTNVYYTGSSEDWKKISISLGNTYLTNANITYNYTPST